MNNLYSFERDYDCPPEWNRREIIKCQGIDCDEFIYEHHAVESRDDYKIKFCCECCRDVWQAERDYEEEEYQNFLLEEQVS